MQGAKVVISWRTPRTWDFGQSQVSTLPNPAQERLRCKSSEVGGAHHALIAATTHTPSNIAGATTLASCCALAAAARWYAMAAAARCYGQAKISRVLRHGKSNRVLSYGSRTGVRCNGCDSRVLCIGSICMALNLLSATIFFSADSSSQPPLYLCCNSATFLFLCAPWFYSPLRLRRPLPTLVQAPVSPTTTCPTCPRNRCVRCWRNSKRR